MALSGQYCIRCKQVRTVLQVSTGVLRVRWARAHDDARITSMAFDLNFRRLITGCENGGVKVTLNCYASNKIHGYRCSKQLIIGIFRQPSDSLIAFAVIVLDANCA